MNNWPVGICISAGPRVELSFVNYKLMQVKSTAHKTEKYDSLRTRGPRMLSQEMQHYIIRRAMKCTNIGEHVT